MKNQHFGENRDLLKFDLVSEVLKSGAAKQFVYVPMLTADESGQEVNLCRHESTGGAENKALLNFLDFCWVNGKRTVEQIAVYFREAGCEAVVYEPETILTRENRKAYFAGIDPESLKQSLVLIDPDKGLEDSDNSPSNLLFSEIRDLYNRMDAESILMFTQKFPDDMYQEYLAMQTAKIRKQIPSSQPISLDDLDSIIFFLPKSKIAQNRLVEVLKEYTKRYAQ